MIDGNFELTGIGLCNLSTQTYDCGSIELTLSHDADEVGLLVIESDPWLDDEKAREISNVKIAKPLRGNGGGSFLIGKAVELAQSSGMSSLRACAVNERTISAFCRHFTSDALTFFRREHIADPLLQLDITPSIAIDYLRGMRQRQYAGESDSTEPLKGFGVHAVGQFA